MRVFSFLERRKLVEGLKDLALDLHRCGSKRFGEVRDPLQLGDQLLVLGLLPLRADSSQGLLERLILAAMAPPLGKRRFAGTSSCASY